MIDEDLFIEEMREIETLFRVNLSDRERPLLFASYRGQLHEFTDDGFKKGCDTVKLTWERPGVLPPVAFFWKACNEARSNTIETKAKEEKEQEKPAPEAQGEARKMCQAILDDPNSSEADKKGAEYVLDALVSETPQGPPETSQHQTWSERLGVKLTDEEREEREEVKKGYEEKRGENGSEKL